VSNYGYHWSRCSGDGDAKVILAGGGLLAGAIAVGWVASHAVAVLAVTAACGALAVAAVVALMRWGDRRERRHAAEHPFLVTRPVPAALTATVIPQVSRATAAPALEQHVHYHVHVGEGDREGARIIASALPGTSGDALTEGGTPWHYPR
jgi:hypothetical protein